MKFFTILLLLTAQLVAAGKCPACYDTDDDFHHDTVDQQRCIITDRIWDRSWDVVIANDFKWDSRYKCGSGFKKNLKNIKDENGKKRKECKPKSFKCERVDERGTVRLSWKNDKCDAIDVMWAINKASYGNIKVGDIECYRGRVGLPLDVEQNLTDIVH